MALSVLLLEEDCGADAFDLALDHHADPVREHVCLLHGVRGEDDRAGALHLLDQLPHLLPHFRVQAGGRLVQENDARVADGCDCQAQPPSHSTAEAFHLVLALSAKPDHLQQFLDLLRPLKQRDALEPGKHLQVLLCRDFVPEDVELRAQTDMLAYFVNVADALPVDDDLGLLVVIGIEDAREDVDERCLASSVVAQNCHQLARLDLHAQLVYRVHFLLGAASPEGLAQAFDAQTQSGNAFLRVLIDPIAFFDG